jgi:hypothetical protein
LRVSSDKRIPYLRRLGCPAIELQTERLADHALDSRVREGESGGAIS